MSLDSLLQRYVDDRDALTPEELDELIAGLRADPERAVALREQLQVDDLLSQKLAIDRRKFLAQVGQRIADYERGQDEMDAQVADVRAIAESSIHAAEDARRMAAAGAHALLVGEALVKAGDVEGKARELMLLDDGATS